GENPARSRHCVSGDEVPQELHCHARVRPCLRRAPATRVAGTRRRNLMSDVTHTKPVALAAPPFSFGQLLPWLIITGMLLLVAMYFVSAEQGVTSLLSGTPVPE